MNARFLAVLGLIIVLGLVGCQARSGEGGERPAAPAVESATPVAALSPFPPREGGRGIGLSATPTQTPSGDGDSAEPAGDSALGGGEDAGTTGDSVLESATPVAALSATTPTPSGDGAAEPAGDSATTPSGDGDSAEPATTRLPDDQTTGLPDCLDTAAFLGESIPDNTVIRQGETFQKTWMLANAGDCAWGAGYSWVFVHGDALGGSERGPLPETLPGKQVRLDLDLTAPLAGGQYVGRYLLENPAGRRFGIDGDSPFWVQILVNYIAPDGSLEPAVAAQPPVQPSTGAPGAAIPAGSGCVVERDLAFETEAAGLINAYRLRMGLPALAVNPQLSAAALDYSVDMACNNRVDFSGHTDTHGRRWYERIAAQGYVYASAYENVYVGNPTFGVIDGTPAGAFSFWVGSDIHNRNMLRRDAIEIGVGYAFTTSSQYGGYYTVVFASP